MGQDQSHVKSLDPDGPDGSSDKELVGRFLKLVAGFSGQEVRRMVPGVTDNDMSRWRRGDFARLSAAKRRTLVAYVEGEPLLRLRTAVNVRRTDEQRASDAAVRRSAGTADAIIASLGDPEFIRRHAGTVSREEWADFGYEIAMRRHLPPDEMKKIMDWRESILRDDS